jgi:hypothetical protein
MKTFFFRFALDFGLPRLYEDHFSCINLDFGLHRLYEDLFLSLRPGFWSSLPL